MSAKLQNPNNRRPPSARDREIYFLHKAQRVKQKDLARELGVDPSRVCQIVRRVRQWLANAAAQDGELDHHQERRLERRIERERLEHLYGESLRMLKDFEKPAESTREAAKGTEKTTREERNARVQTLKSATRLAESLGKIAEREPLPEPAAKGPQGFVRLDQMVNELMRRRTLAEERGKAPASGEVYDVIWFLLRMLEGDPVKPIQPGSPLQAALGKIVATLVEAGAVAVAEEKTEDRGGCDVAATTQSAGQPAFDPLCLAAAAKHSHPEVEASAQVTQLEGYSLLAGCDPEVLETIVASGWLERFKDGGEMHRESLVAASLARENSGELSASGQEPVARSQWPGASGQ